MKRLARFLGKLPTTHRHAIEFRHPSWMDGETMALLREHQAANVWISSLKMPQDYTLTSDFVYLRFHGLKDGPYHDYTDAELAPWAKQLAAATRSGCPAFVYFNNDLNTRAPLHALALMHQLGRRAVPAFARPRESPLLPPKHQTKRGKHAPIYSARSESDRTRRSRRPSTVRQSPGRPGRPPAQGTTGRRAADVSRIPLRGRRPATATTGRTWRRPSFV